MVGAIAASIRSARVDRGEKQNRGGEMLPAKLLFASAFSVQGASRVTRGRLSARSRFVHVPCFVGRVLHNAGRQKQWRGQLEPPYL